MSRKHQEGFTLVEMMVIVVVVGLIAGMTIPPLSSYVQHQRVQGATTELMADIQWTRSMAIARQRTFQIAFAADGYQVIEIGGGNVVRTRQAPQGVTYTADQDPNFFAWGLSDAAAINITGSGLDTAMSLMPNGTVTHNAQ